MAEPAGCADIGRAHHESLHGTASRVTNWLLVEHNHEWDSEAPSSSSLGEAAARALKRVADEHRIRVLLIRKPRRSDSEPRDCFAVHSGMTSQWIQHCPVDDPVELLDIDFRAMRQGIPPSLGRAWKEPLYLVCTHGEHDPCCRRYGRAVADALLLGRPRHAWECSHVGGDRFAANLVCLPHGLYFGRVPAGRGPDIADLYESGVIDLEHYRGRSCYDPIVQVAEILIRSRDHAPRIDDLVFESRRDHSPTESTVGFLDPKGDHHAIRIAARRAARRRITCHATQEGAPREFRVVFGAP